MPEPLDDKLVKMGADESGPIPAAKDTRFKPGNPGSRGNPANAKAQHLRALLIEATTDEEILEVWGAVKAAALDGDMKAADLYLERLLGKVPQALEHTGAEGGAIQVVRYVCEEPSKPAEKAAP